MLGGQHVPPISSPDELKLWEQLCKHSGETFTTFGCDSCAGVELKYEIRGAEMFISTRSKSITRATVLYAYWNVQSIQAEGGVINGPKAIGVHGDSYIFAVFKVLAVINSFVSTASHHQLFNCKRKVREKRERE